jgi:hypothetical protein
MEYGDVPQGATLSFNGAGRDKISLLGISPLYEEVGQSPYKKK